MASEHLDSLREMKARRPFVAFRLRTKRGDVLLVEEFLQFVVRGSKVMYVFPHSDRIIEIASEDIAAIEAAEPKPAV